LANYVVLNTNGLLERRVIVAVRIHARR